MSRFALAFCTCFLLMMPAQADDAKQLFDSLYQKRIEAARRTPDREDDLELARQLIAAARETSDISIIELACDNAYDLSRLIPEGHVIAASAMEFLADTLKSRRPDARGKQVDLLTKRSRIVKPAEREQANKVLLAALLKMANERAESGDYVDAIRVHRQARSIPGITTSVTDTIDWNLALLAQRQRASKQIELLREKLLADANDKASADTLIRLHLVDMDDPQGAAKFITHAGDKDLKATAETAARPLVELKEDDARTLGQWYVEQSKAAPVGINTFMLRRAIQYLSLYLRLHGDTDLTGKAMALQLKEIRKQHRESEPLVEKMLVDLPSKTIHTARNENIRRDVAINRVKLSQSLQTHPSIGRPAQVRFQLEGNYSVIQGGVGVNDPSPGPHSDLTFIIMGDGKELWRSKPTRRKNVVQVFQVSVDTVEQLEIMVSCSASDWHAWAVWIEPTLYSKPVAAIAGKKDYEGIPIDTNLK